MNLDWHARAACRDHPDPDMWFPSSGGLSKSNIDAIMVCRTCPVQQPCLQHAVDTHADGIWGGLTAAQRRPMLRPLGRELVPCGTPGAYRRHVRNGQPPCDLCRVTEMERIARWRAAR